MSLSVIVLDILPREKTLHCFFKKAAIQALNLNLSLACQDQHHDRLQAGSGDTIPLVCADHAAAVVLDTALSSFLIERNLALIWILNSDAARPPDPQAAEAP